MGAKKILMVDDVQLYHKMAADVLKGEYDLLTALNVSEGFKILDKVIPDLILLDIIMPGEDGFSMLKRLKASNRLKDIPVIFLTSETTPEAEIEGFNDGIVDYITKPFVPEIMKMRVRTQIEISEYRHNLEEKVKQKVAEIEEMYDLLTVSFAGLVESRDGVTGGHLKNTSIYYRAFIKHLMTLPQYRDELSENVVKKAIRSAPLHDVGKIAIEDSVLRKSGSLNGEEFEKMKLHSVIGGDIFKFLRARISDKEFADIAEAVSRFHHEKWDGTGYPAGLSGTDIPLVARIMSIVDVYDALTSKRPYKNPFSHEKSMEIIAEGSGTYFDPDLVSVFLSMEGTIRECLTTKEDILVKQNYFMYDKKRN